MVKKKYHWLKLKESFFNEPEIKLILSQPEGEKYLIFYLRLELLSLRSEGVLRHKNIIPYDNKSLATLTDTPLSVAVTGIELFIHLDLIERWDDGTLYMLELQNLIGSESESAERVRRHRSKALQCNENTVHSNTERELELEKELEYIIDYLNTKTSSEYSSKNEETVELHRELTNQGYSKDNFIKVIDNKLEEWTGTKFQQYLRPATLFGKKFESYLNQKISNDNNNNPPQVTGNRNSDRNKAISDKLKKKKG